MRLDQGPGGWRWRPAEVASGALMRTRCWAEVAAKCAGLAQEEFERRRPGIYKRTPRQWRAVVGVVLRLGMTSRGVRRGVSSRPQHLRVLRYSLHHHLWIMAQAPAPVPQEHSHGGPSIMERFKRMALPSFKGESHPLLAESWMREVEKIFRAIRCAEEDKVSLPTYML
ncbi:hypothetical protein Taro_054203 [Colocasia esculenta]|uniref:Uncharacterized protein n=1 Tax=Colocasia esculenta TaxID=4460 RepID=A0A843XN89_COLES|nr:hypothetical protein [Colocasia esculenta]